MNITVELIPPMARNKRSNRKAELGLMDLELLSVLAQAQIAYPAEELDRI